MAVEWIISPNAQIGARLNRLVQAAGPATAALAQTHAARGEAKIKATTAYTDRTGNLRGSSFGRAEGTDIEIGATAHYAIYLELGTRKMSARPFIVPTANEVAPEYFEDCGRLYMRIMGGG
jgi:HK97 gp10 family phage protein